MLKRSRQFGWGCALHVKCTSLTVGTHVPEGIRYSFCVCVIYTSKIRYHRVPDRLFKDVVMGFHSLVPSPPDLFSVYEKGGGAGYPKIMCVT